MLQFEFVTRSTLQAEEMDRGDKDMAGASENSRQVFSPDTLDSCTSQLSQPISPESKGVTNEDHTPKLCANGTEIPKLAQTAEEPHAAILSLQVDNNSKGRWRKQRREKKN